MVSQLPAQVLLIDDDERVRDALVELLTLEGCRVASAAGARAALNYLRQSTAPRVIVLDLMMPDMDGWAFRQELLKDPVLSSIPVVVVTGISADYQLKGYMQAAAYFSKPLDLQALVKTVRQYVTSPAPVPEI